MKLKSVSATYGRRVNLGDYNSLHAEITLWADLEEGDTLQEVAAQLWEAARENVRAQVLRATPEHTAKVQSIFLGLPQELKED